MTALKIIYIVAGFIFTGIGTIGIFLPILPTTPFYLLSALCFFKSSKLLHNWLINTKLYKKHLNDFIENHSMTIKSKLLILIPVTIMLFISYTIVNAIALKIIIAVLLLIKYWYFIFRIKTNRISKTGKRIKPYHLFIMMIVSVLLGACSDINTETEPDISNSDEISIVEESILNYEDNADTTEIIITIGDIVITAVLDNNQTSQEFLQTLPRTMTMTKWGDREYYGRLDSELSENGERMEGYKNGDVMYYPPGPSFAIFYAKDDTSNQGNLIRMGSITSDLAVFDTLDSTVEMRIEISP